MKFFISVVKDILYISKITKTRNKKILILVSVFFSQISALADLILIGYFTFSIADQKTNINVINLIINFLDENPLLIILFVIFRFLFLFLQSYILRKIEFEVTKNLKELVLSEIFEKKTFTIADSYFYINELCGHIGYFYSNFAGLLNNLLQVTIFAIYLISANSFVLAIFGVGILVLFFPIKKIISISREYVDKSYNSMIQSMNEIERVVENLFLIKILKKEESELKKFSKTLGLLNSHLLRNHSYNLINGYLPSFLTLFILSLIILFFRSVIFLTLDFIGVTIKLFNSFSLVSTSASNIFNSHVHIAKFKKLDFTKSNYNKSNYTVINQNYIEFSNVDFKYSKSNDHIFSKLNLKFFKGSHVIITGDNGTGKSTLLGLIAGLYYPTSGSISTFSNNFGYVSASPYIFHDTLKNNIIYGSENLNIDENKIINLLAEFNTFKDKNDYNLNRMISNKTLSSGQMQKIGFIRAIISNPEVILLDESTSNLDFESKSIVFNKLKSEKITIINSTHDPENFEFADSQFKIFSVDGRRSIKKIR